MISTAREYFTVDLRGLRAALAARAELAADIVDFVKGRPPRREIEQRPSRPEPHRSGGKLIELLKGFNQSRGVTAKDLRSGDEVRGPTAGPLAKGRPECTSPARGSRCSQLVGNDQYRLCSDCGP
jgi:hypothetical protein